MSDTCFAIFDAPNFSLYFNSANTPNFNFFISSNGAGLSAGDSVYFKVQTSDSNKLSVIFNDVSGTSDGSCYSSDQKTIRCTWNDGANENNSHVIEGQAQASGAGLFCDQDGQVANDNYTAALLGYYSVSGTACQNHIQYRAGSFSTSALLSCTKCPSGSYSSTAGSTSCTFCAAGQSSPVGSTSLSSCTACPNGTFSPEAGSSCVSCPVDSKAVRLCIFISATVIFRDHVTTNIACSRRAKDVTYSRIRVFERQKLNVKKKGCVSKNVACSRIRNLFQYKKGRRSSLTISVLVTDIYHWKKNNGARSSGIK